MKKFIFLVILLSTQIAFGAITTYDEFVSYLQNEKSTQQDFNDATHYVLSLFANQNYDEIGAVEQALQEQHKVFEVKMQQAISPLNYGFLKAFSFLLAGTGLYSIWWGETTRAYNWGYWKGMVDYIMHAAPIIISTRPDVLVNVHNELCTDVFDKVGLGIDKTLIGAVLLANYFAINNSADTQLEYKKSYLDKIGQIENFQFLIEFEEKNS